VLCGPAFCLASCAWYLSCRGCACIASLQLWLRACCLFFIMHRCDCICTLACNRSIVSGIQYGFNACHCVISLVCCIQSAHWGSSAFFVDFVYMCIMISRFLILQLCWRAPGRVFRRVLASVWKKIKILKKN
jgi:hypothetical protein